MTLTAGALSQVSVGPTTASLSSAAATGGVGPYTYQWYRSTTTGFSPGGGNIITGATSLTLNDSGLVPGTQYYYKVVVTDTGDSNTTDDSSQLSVLTAAPTLSPNQFAQTEYLGAIDMRFPYNTVSVQIDASQVGALYAGSPVKIVDSAGGIPKVVGIEAVTDNVMGYINYDIKSKAFVAGSLAEISMAGNVIWLYSVGAVSRGAEVVPSLITRGGVAAASGSGGENIVGWAYDKADAGGQLIRVFLKTPSFAFDA